MSGYVWDISQVGEPCYSYAPGHQVHFIQFNLANRDPGPLIPVSAAVDENGLVQLTGPEVNLTRWHHRPAVLADALHRFGGRAEWQPRWHVLWVPTATSVGTASSVFCLGELADRRACGVTTPAAQ